MDSRKYLIFLKGADRTSSISRIYPENGVWKVSFNGNRKVYKYSMDNVELFQEQGKVDITDKDVYVKGNYICNVEEIIDFGKWYRIIQDKNRGFGKVYPVDQVSFSQGTVENCNLKNRFESIREIAKAISLYGDNEYNILGNQFNEIKSIDDGSLLSSYLSDEHDIVHYKMPKQILYPFGINLSQKKAVENALTSQVSLIEGPPGTGKTQTILNIVANLISFEKTVAVVSNNNTAIKNVVDKLKKDNLDFQCAILGSVENKENFIKNQKAYPCEIDTWAMSKSEIKSDTYKLAKLTSEVDKKLLAKNRIAKIRGELSELRMEYNRFSSINQPVQNREFDSAIQTLTSDKILAILAECEDRAENGTVPGFLERIKLFFRYGGRAKPFIYEKPEIVIPYLQNAFYIKHGEELEKEESKLKKELQNYLFDEKMKEITFLSDRLFKDTIEKRCRGRRKEYSKADLTRHSKEFVKEYPIILSTTYSIKKALNSNFIYDYIIVDEASMVDLATGVLAMSCAKNIVIVGDLKQLPNVVTDECRKKTDRFWNPSIGEAYRFAEHSLLSSAEVVWKDAPKVLLREHYRCSPKIINFCNKKFYNNQLIVMTNEKEDIPSLRLYKTPIGNHERNRMNQREIDIIKNEVIPSLGDISEKDVGIIAPYNNQVDELKKQISKEYEIDTVHKFQGREKSVIILTSVDNNTKSDFVNNPNLLNVAVSRAEDMLVVVTSGNKENANSNYGALARYIKYNNCEVVESRVCSVFDLLYRQYFKERLAYLKKRKRISEYDSENLMYSIIENILSEEKYSYLGCACHVSLCNTIREYSGFTEDEKQYALNPLTHNDFIIFDSMDKSPVLAVEVDGVSFHKEGSRQSERDKMKNHIFEKTGIPLMRFRTNESQEEDRLRKKLDEILK